MSPESRTAPASRPDAGRGGSLFRLAIVGGATLKGKEVAEVLNERNFPARDVKLLDDDESLGQLEPVGDEVTFVQSVTAERLENVDITFFAAEESFTGKHWKMAQEAGSAIIDLSYALEQGVGAVVRSPWIERQRGQAPPPQLQPAPVVVAHPAAVVLALLVLRAGQAGSLQRVVATILEPVSEHGRRGMDELHQQTVNLLSFQPLPKSVFDAQVAFNLLARYGEHSRPTLESVQRRVLSHYQKISGAVTPVPSLALLQAPIFHGHALSVYLEFEHRVEQEEMREAVAGEHVRMAPDAEEPPSNVNAAGQEDVLLHLRRDPGRESGFWLWAAADNLRIAATTAVECAEGMALARPRGKIQ